MLAGPRPGTADAFPSPRTETVAALTCPPTYETAYYPLGSGRERAMPVPFAPVAGVVCRYPHAPDGGREAYSHATQLTTAQLADLRDLLNGAKLDQRTVTVCDAGPADVIILRRPDTGLDTIIVNAADCGDFYSSRFFDPKASDSQQAWLVSKALQSWLDALAAS